MKIKLDCMVILEDCLEMLKAGFSLGMERSSIKQLKNRLRCLSTMVMESLGGSHVRFLVM